MTSRPASDATGKEKPTQRSAPTCAAPLYGRAKQPSEGAGVAVRGHPEERSREAASTAIVAPSATPPRPSALPPNPKSTTPAEAPVHEIPLPRRDSSSPSSSSPSPSAPGSTPTREPTEEPRGSTQNTDGADRDAPLCGPGRGGHSSRLWRWDLSSGRAVRGPRVPRAVELVDARGASFGWVGVTSELPDGRLQASVLRFLEPDDRATPILDGDVVSWGPQGASVIAGRRGPLRPGCRRSVSIVWARLVPALRETKYADPALCGDLLSIGLNNASTMLTLDRGAAHRDLLRRGLGTAPSRALGLRPGRDLRRCPTSSWFHGSRSPP